MPVIVKSLRKSGFPAYRAQCSLSRCFATRERAAQWQQEAARALREIAKKLPETDADFVSSRALEAARNRKRRADQN